VASLSKKTADELADLEKQAKQFGAMQFSPEEVALLLNVTENDITQRPTVYRAYTAGRLQANAMIRKHLYAMAQDGDLAALKEFQRLCL
jgi:hypothetical protein